MNQRLDQQTLDSIAEDFARAIRDGENPDIDTFVAQHDDPSGELRSLLASIAMIEGLKHEGGPAPHESVVSLRQLDDYQVVREIGRGGMGVVFEAIHQSLGRRVALKVLSSSLLDKPKHHARFRREARAAARLRHPNIVSVFGVGQSGDHHYYVMDFIRGLSLREWLQSLTGDKDRFLPTRAESIANSESDLQFDTTTFGGDQTASSSSQLTLDNSVSESVPTDTDSNEYFRWVARIGLMVCDALQYAHDQGVLHRDIKPANLLLDQKGCVWIADFGLAKLTGQDATMTGDIVGTPQYMSPESFDGEYNETSETYCVGLTLYELLTLRPAIEGKSASDTIRKATEGVSTAPRKLNQHIPRDLETVVLKSLAVDQEKRYSTAGQLRDDLKRFLSDRPISARRIGPAERLYRWSRREPALASMTLGIFACLMALAFVASAAYLKTKGALTQARHARGAAEASAQVAEEQRLLAQSNLQVAIRAFDEISQRIVDGGSEPDAELLGDIDESVSLNVTPQDAELLNSLLTFFDELAQNNGEDAQLKRQTAAARKRVGDIYSRLGKFNDAENSYEEAMAIYTEIARDAPSDEILISQATLLNEQASIAGLRGRVDDAVTLHKETVDLLRSSETAITSADGRFEYARANSLFSQISTRSGLTSLGRKYVQRGSFFRSFGRPKNSGPRPYEEVVAADAAVEALESLFDESPDDRRYGVALARAYRDRANAALKVAGAMNPNMQKRDPRISGRGVPDAARRFYSNRIRSDLDQSIKMLRGYMKADPDSESLKYELGKSLLVKLPFQTPDLRIMKRDRIFEARGLSQQLLRASNESPRYRALYAEAMEQLVRMRRNQGNLDLALSSLTDLHSMQKQLLADSPGLSRHQAKLAESTLQLADLLSKKGDNDRAVKYLAETLEILSETDNSPIARGKIQSLNRRLSELRRAGESS